MPNYWWYSLDNLALVGGAILLVATARVIIALVIRWRIRARSAERSIVERSGREDELKIERAIFWPGYIIGFFSWASANALNFDTLGTIALNAVVAYASWFILNHLYAYKYVRDVGHRDLDEGIANQTIEHDMVHVAWGKALVAGIGAGTVLAHGSFGVLAAWITENLPSLIDVLLPALITEHIPGVTLINVAWGVVILPLLVVWGMAVVGKMDTVWRPLEIFRRNLKKMESTT